MAAYPRDSTQGALEPVHGRLNSPVISANPASYDASTSRAVLGKPGAASTRRAFRGGLSTRRLRGPRSEATTSEPTTWRPPKAVVTWHEGRRQHGE